MAFLSFKTDTRDTEGAFNAAARAADKAATKGIREAARRVALPSLQSAVAHRLPGKTQVGATQRGAYARQKHPGAALDEFGGVRNDIIHRSNGKPLRTPDGPRAVVKGPRKYKPANVFVPAVQRLQPQMRRIEQEEVLKAFAAQGFKVSQ